VNDEVQLAKRVFGLLHHCLNMLVVADVAGFKKCGTDGLNQLGDLVAIFRTIPGVRQVCETKLRAFFVEVLCDRPGNRTIVCDSQYEALLPFKQRHAHAAFN
jgi:hypothetical protein